MSYNHGGTERLFINVVHLKFACGVGWGWVIVSLGVVRGIGIKLGYIQVGLGYGDMGYKCTIWGG